MKRTLRGAASEPMNTQTREPSGGSNGNGFFGTYAGLVEKFFVEPVRFAFG